MPGLGATATNPRPSNEPLVLKENLDLLHRLSPVSDHF
nr:hypothetical protein JVH1_0016 [Rhodococcus sp. JVH1]